MNRAFHLHHESGAGAPRDWHAMLDLYVDGLLSADDAAAFESRLRVDSSLRGLLDAQRRIDASLKTQFAVPAGAGAAAGQHPWTVAVKPGKTILARIGWLRIAAMVAIVALAGVVFGMRHFAATAYPTESPIAAYQSIVHGGFRPYEECTTDEEFAKYTEQYLGKALQVQPFNGLMLVGWDNRHNVMSIETDALLAKVNDTQVVVFMDKAEHSRRLPSKGEGLNVFKREVAGVVLVEVSPLSEPKILSRFCESKACEPGKDGAGTGRVIRRGN